MPLGCRSFGGASRVSSMAPRTMRAMWSTTWLAISPGQQFHDRHDFMIGTTAPGWTSRTRIGLCSMHRLDSLDHVLGQVDRRAVQIGLQLSHAGGADQVA